MKKFLVLYLAPIAVLEEWAKSDPVKRKETEEKMQADWRNWMKEHQDMVGDTTVGVGKTKRITSKGVADTKNDIMLYCTVEAESHDAAAKLFENHPHLGIPESSIEVMALNPLSGM